jgi:hypothetical protein
MKTTMNTRLTALESKLPEVVDTERSDKFRATVRAFFTALEIDAVCAKEPPYLKPSTSELSQALIDRLDSGTASEAELEMLESLPKCHLPPRTILNAINTFLRT